MDHSEEHISNLGTTSKEDVTLLTLRCTLDKRPKTTAEHQRQVQEEGIEN